MIDIGANLTDRSFDADRDRVITSAFHAGVDTLIVTGSTVDNSEAGLRLARLYPGRLFSTAGLHPHHGKDWSDEAENTLRSLAAEPEVVALGECGLDFNRNLSPHEDQERCFEAQLALAAELQLPVFLHERDAHETFLAILARWRDRIPRAVVHCFTGEEDGLTAYLDLDLHIGITGWICDERRGRHLRELVGRIPRGRIMIETDAPYLIPRDMRPKPKTRRNEPQWLPWVARRVAACRGESLEDFLSHADAATRAFFALTAE